MGSSSSIPWYNVPPRRFPAQVWLEARYPFRVPRSAFVWQAAPPPGAWRPFPALVWWQQRQTSGG